MTLVQLEYIVAVDTYRSFSLAADKCLVTQPTLSMQVRKLEKELGAALFDRSRQPVIPTEVGSVVLQQARIVLREAGRLPLIADELERKLEGSLVIGIIPTVAPYLLPYFAGPFTKRYPEIRLDIRELKTGEITDLLQRDMLDAGILATPLHEKGVHEEPLYYEEILLYVHPSHRLAGCKDVQPAELEAGDMWMLSEGNCFRDHVVNLCSLRSELPLGNLRYESGSLETLKKMVDVEGGYTLLPELAVLEMPARELKRIRHFVVPVPLREVSLVYARSASKRTMLDKLRQVIEHALPDDIRNRGRGRLVEWT